MNLVGQAAGYIGSRQPAPKAPKQGGGGGPMRMLNPLQFGRTLGTGGLPNPTVPMGGSGGSPFPAAGDAGGVSAEELLPLALA